MLRKLIIQKELPGGLPEFPVAVCERKGNVHEVIGWLRTEADARMFVEAEEQIARLKQDLSSAESRARSAISRMLCSAAGRGRA